MISADEGKVIIEFNGLNLWSNGMPMMGGPPASTPAPVELQTPAPANSGGGGAAVVLPPRSSLKIDEFVESPSGRFRLGLQDDGEFVLQENSSPRRTLWCANIVSSHGPNKSDRIFMQGDGNLVIREPGRDALWTSGTDGNPDASLLITDNGRAIIVSSLGDLLWSKSTGGICGDSGSGGSSPPTTPAPQTSPGNPSYPMGSPPPENVVLEGNQYLVLGDFVYSPNGNYRLGLKQNGEFVLETSQGREIWSAGIVSRFGSGKTFRCYLQSDGNLIVRDNNRRSMFRTSTHGNDGSYLAVNDGGQIAIMHSGVPIWLQGIPRGTYQTPPSSEDLQFPVRAAFYYPWYPATWTVSSGELAKFEPDLGFYSSGDPNVAEAHVDMLEYGYTDLSIASWWGQDTKLDKARLTLLMDKTIEMGSSMKWTVYQEEDRHEDQSPDELRSDLDYLKEWFAWHPAWAHIDGRPVIFVYNKQGCDVADRWTEAAGSDWYVVLRMFPGFRDCTSQPDSWHQYGPAFAVVDGNADYSFGVSPGFWHAAASNPVLPRVKQSDFCANVKEMVQSGADWHLVTTFNEAGEGTMIEPSRHWASSSGYGIYLDCLHRYHH